MVAGRQTRINDIQEFLFRKFAFWILFWNKNYSGPWGRTPVPGLLTKVPFDKIYKCFCPFLRVNQPPLESMTFNIN